MISFNTINLKSKFINLFILILAILTINIFGLDTFLFYKINSYHYLLSDNIWKAINLLAYSKYSILLLILLLITYKYKKQYMLRVLLLCFSYFISFYLLKKLFHEPRPYAVLSSSSFYFIPHFENYLKSAYMSFPSGHTGQVAIFVFAVFELFKPNSLIKIGLVLLLLLVGIARICSGWHWPTDIIASVIFAYIISIVVFSTDTTLQKNDK